MKTVLNAHILPKDNPCDALPIRIGETTAQCIVQSAQCRTISFLAAIVIRTRSQSVMITTPATALTTISQSQQLLMTAEE